MSIQRFDTVEAFGGQYNICAAGFVTTGKPGHTAGRNHYLADRVTRRLAQKMSRSVNEALKRWKASQDNTELESKYRSLRRALIVTIKEHRHAAPAF